MPRIENTIPPSPSRQLFKKKNYRPWNLLDDITVERQQSITAKTNTNQTQTRHKQDTEQRTNRTQIEHTKTNDRTQTEHKSNTKQGTNWDTNRTQTEHKQNTTACFSMLVGLQRKIMLFLYENCKITRSKITEPLTLEHLSNQLNIRIGSVKTTLRRLQIKSFIKRLDFKIGRGGWSKYEVPNNLFSELMQLETEHKAGTNWAQYGHKQDTKQGTKPNTGMSSGSSINIKTTTTGEANSMLGEFSEEWQSLDIEPLNQIGFTATHLSQIASQNKLSPQIIQDSIYSFAFDLQENSKAKSIKGDPINFFMGILRNGKPYLAPSNYESPQDRAMRLYLARRSEIEKKKEDIEKEAIDLAFKEWFAQLTSEQKRELLPEMLRNTARLENNKLLESSARNRFEKEIWLGKRNDIIQETKSTELSII